MLDERFFFNQVERLNSAFGKKNFPDERVALIWDAIRGIRNEDLKSMVDGFIGDSHRAPLREDFLRVIREQRLYQHRQEESKAAKDLYRGELDGDTITKSIGFILKNMHNPEKLDQFSNAITQKQKTCKFCNGDGFIYGEEKDEKHKNDVETVFKCVCVEGKKKAKLFLVGGGSSSTPIPSRNQNPRRGNGER